MKSETSVQKSGWIVWWINTVLYVLAAIAVVVMIYVIPDQTFKPADKALAFVVLMLLFFFAALTQVLAFFMIKFIHRDNSYLYPIILIVLAFLGPWLYYIPGIWGVLYTNHQKMPK